MVPIIIGVIFELIIMPAHIICVVSGGCYWCTTAAVIVTYNLIPVEAGRRLSWSSRPIRLLMLLKAVHFVCFNVVEVGALKMYD